VMDLTVQWDVTASGDGAETPVSDIEIVLSVLLFLVELLWSRACFFFIIFFFIKSKRQSKCRLYVFPPPSTYSF